MPTRAESGLQMNGLPEMRYKTESTESWTDDLPVCIRTGVGTQNNQVYRRNGGRQEMHPCEDKSFHFCMNSNTCFYGLFDGHYGTKAANFAASHLPAEVLLDQLMDKRTDFEVSNVLMQAFTSVEKEYFQSIADVLAEKASLELQMQGMPSMMAYNSFPEIVERLKSLRNEVSSGTAAVVALFHYNSLHVANVGDSRAILCKTDTLGSYTAIQLSTDHDLLNDDELVRLSKLGLDIDSIRQRQRIGNISITRCIGNYMVKGSYKDLPDLCVAKDEPVIPEPNITSIPIDDSCQFLILASGSLCRTLEEVTGSRQVNRDIIQMVAEEFKYQSTLTGVAQAVVNKICLLHQDQYLAALNDPNLPQSCNQIEDLTLMVRNFNHPLLRGLSSSNSRSPSVSSMSKRFDEQLRVSISEENENENYPNYRNRSSSRTLMTGHSVLTVTDDVISALQNSESTTTTTTTTNSTEFEDRRFDSRKADPLEVDSEGKIASYVSFDEFLESIEEAKRQEVFVDFED